MQITIRYQHLKKKWDLKCTSATRLYSFLLAQDKRILLFSSLFEPKSQKSLLFHVLVKTVNFVIVLFPDRKQRYFTLLITITITEIPSILCSCQDSQKGGRSDLSEPGKSSPSHPPPTDTKQNKTSWIISKYLWNPSQDMFTLHLNTLWITPDTNKKLATNKPQTTNKTLKKNATHHRQQQNKTKPLKLFLHIWQNSI